MNFSKFDVTVLVTMSLAVVVMSFLFPALGMTDDDAVNESDVPEFNMSASTFDFTGEFPQQPNTPTSGVLEFDQQQGNSIAGVTLIYVDRPPEPYAIEVQNTSQEGLDVAVTNFSDTGDTIYRYNINSEGQTILHQEDGWTILFEVESLENFQQPNMTADVSFDVRQDPGSQEGLSAIPIIGGLADAVAGAVAYIGTIFFWGSLFVVELVVNVMTIVTSTIVYLFGVASWLVTTYSSIVSAAPSWAGVVLTIPGILLFTEFAKLSVIGIKMLPTT